MAQLRKTRGAQRPLVAQFAFAFNDTMANTAGTTAAPINSTSGTTFDIVDLPPGAIVVGGEVIVDTAFTTTGAATISLGDSASATRYANAVNMKAAARTALTVTGYNNVGGLSLRMTLSLADTAAAAGAVRIQLQYIIDQRVDEAL